MGKRFGSKTEESKWYVEIATNWLHRWYSKNGYNKENSRGVDRSANNNKHKDILSHGNRDR